MLLTPYSRDGELHWRCEGALADELCNGDSAPSAQRPASPEAESPATSDAPPSAPAEWLLGSWHADAGAASQVPVLQFGSGRSVLLRFPGGATALGTYTLNADFLVVRVSAGGGRMDLQFEVDRDRTWLRSYPEGVVYARTG